MKVDFLIGRALCDEVYTREAAFEVALVKSAFIGSFSLITAFDSHFSGKGLLCVKFPSCLCFK